MRVRICFVEVRFFCNQNLNSEHINITKNFIFRKEICIDPQLGYDDETKTMTKSPATMNNDKKCLALCLLICFIIICFLSTVFFFMIFPIFLIFIPRILSMNPISALGHSALAKKDGVNKPQSPAVIRAPTPYASPPQAMDKDPKPCSPFPSCINSPERVANAIFSDTPKSIDIELTEDQRE